MLSCDAAHIMSVPATQFDTNVFDTRALADIRRQAKDGDPQALKAAAKQFEALFLQMVLKSMRDATPQEGIFDNDQTRMYQSLLDSQLAQSLAGKGNTGLAALIEKQLTRALAPVEGEGADLLPRAFPLERNRGPLPLNTTPSTFPLGPAAVTPGDAAPAAGLPATAGEFVNRVWPYAVEASRNTGIPPAFLVAHAALESGWGKAEPRRADGSPSFNLFGVKAGRSWSGAAVEASTTEYVDGVAQRQTERFRAYGSYAESFQDYAKLLAGNPRFSGVLASRDGDAFARNLQQSGYATDPAYADKLKRILSGTTLRQALAG